MLSLARGFGRLPATRSATAAAIVVAMATQRRSTVIVTRKHEVDRPYPELDGHPMHEIDDFPDRAPIHSKLYETAELRAAAPDSQQLIGVTLLRDVPGLGESGQTVPVHRSRYWHYLYPLGWASIAVGQQQLQHLQSGSGSGPDWRNSRVFTGSLYRLQRTLEAMHLLVPVNRDTVKASDSSLRLTDRHVSVAFRRYGIEIPRRAVRLPDKPPALTAAGRPFSIGVQLNAAISVSVKASLQHVTLGESGTGLPPARLPEVKVDDWLADMHPDAQLPEGVRVFEPYLLQQGPPNFENLLGSNRVRVKKSTR